MPSRPPEEVRPIAALPPPFQNRPAPAARRTRFLPIAAILGLLALAYALGLFGHLSPQQFVESRERLAALVEESPVLSALVFLLVYAALVALAFPAASLCTIVGGFLFGWLFGGLLTVLAATAGAALLFLAARHAFGDLLRHRAGPAVERFADGFRRDAFSYLLVLRLTPVLPFVALNIAPAFFDIRLSTFVAATGLGIVPGSFAYAYLGSGLDAALETAGEGPFHLSDLATPELTLALGGLAALAVLGLVLKRTVLKRTPPGGRGPR